MKKLWYESNDLSDFARKATESSDAFSIEAEGEALVLIYPQCYCAFVKRSENPVPMQWCYCSLGYAEEMFSAVTGHSAKAELCESVATGGEKYRIKIHID